jgi:hypothetical protein
MTSFMSRLWAAFYVLDRSLTVSALTIKRHLRKRLSSERVQEPYKYLLMHLSSKTRKPPQRVLPSCYTLVSPFFPLQLVLFPFRLTNGSARCDDIVDEQDWI